MLAKAMTDTPIPELRALWEATTQGEWDSLITGPLGDQVLIAAPVPGKGTHRIDPVCVMEHQHPKAEANATFIAIAHREFPRLLSAWEENERLRAVIESAAAWFQDYERQHLAKNPPDTAKAETNAARARTLLAALSPTQPEQEGK